MPADGGLGSWADRALDRDVQQRGLAASQRSLECRRQILSTFDKLAVTTQALHHLIVAGLEQISSDGAAVETEMVLPLTS